MSGIYTGTPRSFPKLIIPRKTYLRSKGDPQAYQDEIANYTAIEQWANNLSLGGTPGPAPLVGFGFLAQLDISGAYDSSQIPIEPVASEVFAYFPAFGVWGAVGMLATIPFLCQATTPGEEVTLDLIDGPTYSAGTMSPGGVSVQGMNLANTSNVVLQNSAVALPSGGAGAINGYTVIQTIGTGLTGNANGILVNTPGLYLFAATWDFIATGLTP